MAALSNVSMNDEAAGTRRKLVVVDANRDSTAILSSLLGHMDCDVAIAHGVTAAAALVQSFRPQVVMIELGSRDASPYCLASALRKERDPTELLLIAVSAWGAPVQAKRVADAGFDYHLHKPYAIDELWEIVEAARALPRRTGIFSQGSDEDAAIAAAGSFTPLALRQDILSPAIAD